MMSKFKIGRVLSVCSVILLLILGSKANAFASVEYYQLKIYHIKTQAQEDRLDKYLQNAYVPAVKRAGLGMVGVFKSMATDTDKRVYVFLTFKNLKQIEAVDAKLLKDKQYLEDGKDYLTAANNDFLYKRFEIVVLRAFKKWPTATSPQLSAAKADRVYELRSYESPNERYYANKVKMFNDGGETVLFNRLKFNAIFYADVLAGSHMPNLMYMTTFNSKADRDQHWQTFSDDDEWKKLSLAPEYQHNVSKADIVFLHPAEYSDY